MPILADGTRDKEPTSHSHLVTRQVGARTQLQDSAALIVPWVKTRQYLQNSRNPEHAPLPGKNIYIYIYI
jgi:hypothetical protein